MKQGSQPQPDQPPATRGLFSTLLEPQPGLGHLDRLVEDVRRAGVPVDLVRHGDGRRLPGTVDLSAYRIVQESLTNVMKHAGPCTARVRVEESHEWIELEITDDGRGSAAQDEAHGRGLAGMRERVRLLGGTVVAGPRDPGFGVLARLPL